MKRKNFVWFTLSILICLSVFSLTVFAAGTMKFKDVKTTDWFYNNVKNAYENGLINGKSDTEFAPHDKITYAEVVTLAARMNQRYNYGQTTQTSGNPWYKPYVDYCKERGIIKKDYTWTDYVTRAVFMEIFANALPAEMFEENSYVPDGAIPDVPMTHPQAASIYKLYRAGILQGVDSEYHCNPSASITRKEVAAVLERMTYPQSREVVIIADRPYIKTQPQNISAMKGDDVVFSIEAAGGVEPYTYQWYYSKDNGDTWNVHNSKKEKLIFTVTDFTWMYRCDVKDAAGRLVESNHVKITEIPSDLGCKYRLSDVTAA
ncbi:MAG: S-layer homology domain-containing protein, partial [Clostridia bacterium]|nr:S-layer homology domain-containing protein [Clostridia bacterium]